MQNKNKKRSPKKPDPDTLIGKQREGFDTFCNFIESGETMFCLEGFGGTGKSFLTSMFVEHLLVSHGTRICITAPTHKAVRVIQEMADFETKDLTYSTIHSLLGLRPEITYDGKEIFVRDKKNKNSVEDYDLIFIDEASMLDDMLFGFILEELDKNPYLKIIFILDGKQLPPINHKSSVPASEQGREKYGIGHFLLDQIIRQKGTNPVISFSKEIRNGQFKPRTMVNDDGHGIIVVPKKNQYTVLKKMFCSDSYDQDPDYCRLTAYRNETVNAYNDAIRKMIYKNKILKRMKSLENLEKDEQIKILKSEFPYYRNGEMNLPKYLIGDKVIVDKPLFDPIPSNVTAGGVEICDILFHTSEELIIEEITTDTILGLGEAYLCYIAKVRNLYNDDVQNIEMIHEDDFMKFERHREKLRQDALNQKKKTKAARDAWLKYYSLEKRFARLKYAPCLTTHKSQGSTYENIIMMIPDMLSNRNKEEVFRLLYVGVTRCKSRAFLFV